MADPDEPRRAAPPATPSAVAIAIKARRVARGLTQKDVSDLTGGALTKSHISMIESGVVADPGITKIMAIAEALDYTLGVLFREARGAEEVLESQDVGDGRQERLMLLKYWDELAEERRPAALEIIQILASEQRVK